MLRRVANFIRSALRSWLGVLDAPLSIEEEAKRQNISVAQETLRRAGEKQIVSREFKAPVLMPGVVPTDYSHDPNKDPGGLGPFISADSEFVAPSYAYANQFNCGLGFPGYAYLAELTQRSEYRAPTETLASEMVREWIKIIVKGKEKGKEKTEEGVDADGDGDIDNGLEDKIQRLTEAMEEFKIRELFEKAAVLDGFFGRAQIFIDIERPGVDPDDLRQLPLVIDAETIPKGSLKKFKVIEPIWTTPFTYNATDPTREDFYVPRAWFVLGKRIHASRLMTFIMRPVPDILKPAYNFSGLSMTQLMEPDVFQWLRTRNSVSDLVHNFSVMVLATDMTNVLSGQPDLPGGLQDRSRLFTQYRDNQGLTVIDKDREELVAVNVPLSGLDKLMAQFQEHMAAPSHIPLVKLTGITPSGLNASSEGEIKVWNDYTRASQQKFYGPNLDQTIQILQLHLFGEIDDAIGYEFLPLSSPTVKELAEIRKSDAETDAIYIDKGVIAPEESRERVNNDPLSGYDNLSADAPEPPDVTGLETEHQLNEKSANAAHKRDEESAEAAHKRQLETDKANSGNKAA